MFPPEKKNRLMNAWEQQQEKEDAKTWFRPQRTFIFDPPTYPWVPPEPYVNFHLNYKIE